MTWGGVAIGAGLVISSYLAYEATQDATDASKDAADTAADAEMASLNYLKDINKLPQQFKEGALKRLGGLAGLEGGEGNQQELIDQAIKSPLYQNIMGGKEAGEEAILGNASATGGLRSGDVNANMYDYNTRLQNDALLTSYNEQLMGLQGLAGLPTNENNIANKISNVGNIQSQGILDASQIQQAGMQNLINNTMGWSQLGVSAYGAGMFSDRRLKTNIKKVGTVKGFNFYSFDWNSIANRMGLTGSTYGCMADEVFEVVPEAVSLRNNFMFVNYSTIGVL